MSILLILLELWIFFHEAMPSRYTYVLAVFDIGIALLMFIDIYSYDELSIKRTLCVHILDECMTSETWNRSIKDIIARESRR